MALELFRLYDIYDGLRTGLTVIYTMAFELFLTV